MHVNVLDVASSCLDVVRWQAGRQWSEGDFVAEETPIALVYNGVSHAVMLATAHDLEDFALGFSLSEGIIEDASECYEIEVLRHINGIELRCQISSERFVQLKARRRTLAGKTGCGLCGAESLMQVMRYPKVLSAMTAFDPAVILSGVKAMQAEQALQAQTGATHACAYLQADGSVQILREDVGRHNALDKLVGAMAKLTAAGQLSDRDGFIVTTSRASYEMVQKTAAAGVPMLVAVSAPTGLAVRVADACGLTLVGFARDHKCVVYSHPERILS
ncbi:MAG: formate dehydrogenase accessory sulfurtransferase FdhD [Betaproteobacteria bacterium]|nr:formate dehydrogenase accessory sulfurtransferase FdhD [Betaproteobacteria bacterium]